MHPCAWPVPLAAHGEEPIGPVLLDASLTEGAPPQRALLAYMEGD